MAWNALQWLVASAILLRRGKSTTYSSADNFVRHKTCCVPNPERCVTQNRNRSLVVVHYKPVVLFCSHHGTIDPKQKRLACVLCPFCMCTMQPIITCLDGVRVGLFSSRHDAPLVPGWWLYIASLTSLSKRVAWLFSSRSPPWLIDDNDETWSWLSCLTLDDDNDDAESATVLPSLVLGTAW